MRRFQQRLTYRPKLGQGEQCMQLCRVFGRPSIAHFDRTELALDHPKQLLAMAQMPALVFSSLPMISPMGVLLSSTFRLPGRMARCPIDIDALDG